MRSKLAGDTEGRSIRAAFLRAEVLSGYYEGRTITRPFRGAK